MSTIKHKKSKAYEFEIQSAEDKRGTIKKVKAKAHILEKQESQNDGESEYNRVETAVRQDTADFAVKEEKEESYSEAKSSQVSIVSINHNKVRNFNSIVLAPQSP